MDEGIGGKRQTNPRERASIFSIITFFFTYDIFKKGIRRELTEEDIYDILKDYRSKKLADQLEAEWEKEKKRTNDPSVFWTMMRCYGKTYISYGALQLVMKTILIIISPLAMGKLVSYFSPGQTQLTKTDAVFYAAVTIGTNFCYFVYSHSYMLLITQLGLKVRAAFCSLLYRKALKLTAASLGEVTTGKIVTLISKDVHCFDSAIMFGNDLWIGVIQTTLIGYLMYSQIGISAIIGLAFFVVMIPLQLYFGKRISIYRIKTAGKTDERLRVTQETLGAIKIIKMYTWEKFFAKTIDIFRKYEINTLRKIYYLKAVSLSLGTLSSKLSFYICVMCYIYFGNLITAQKAFVVLGCYHTLRSTLTIYIPLGISQMAELRSGLQRIKHVLTSAEAAIDTNASQKIEVVERPRISINKASVHFENKKLLEGISLEIGPGLTTLTGNVGSGKSALLSLILKDLSASEGSVKVEGTIAYASQEPWLFPGTIRQNILFGQPYEKQRYEKTIYACCLKRDLDMLPNGENTLAADKGLNLSKGQQARINLARAVYKDCDIYLLDDCLSALDAHVSKHVYNECIKGILRDKICLLVTHQMQHLQLSDHIIVLNQGVIENTGSYRELEQKGANLKTVNVNENMKEYQGENGPVPNEAPEADESSKLLVTKVPKVYSETKQEGNVDKTVYKKYFAFGGGKAIITCLLVFFAIAQVSTSYSDILVGKWVDIEQNITSFKVQNLTNTTAYEKVLQKHERAVNMYTIMVGVATVFTLGRAFSFFLFSSRASVRLHNAIFQKILQASMQFFDTHLIGNILNRFSRDLGTIDEYIPYIIFDAFRIFCILLGIIYVVCSVSIIFLLPTIVFAIILFYVRRCYLPTSRSLKRLEGVTRSPVVGHLSASLEGLPTIRASKAQKILQDEFDKHQDVFNSVYYMYMTASRAFGFFLDFLCINYITIITTTFLTIDTGALAGKVGLALTQAFSLTGLLQWGIRQWAELENQMTCVERVLEYTTVTPEKKTGRRPANWPSNGRIEYSDVSLTYHSSTNPVLKNLSFVIEPQQKVGIVGRTGAGKSSIIATLFRLYDVEGTITIDDENIKDLAVETLRSKMSIIPQDPVLFSGTIRDNLDPNSEYPDNDIWKALEEVKLKEVLPNLLFKISEGGGNFSAGQRQLICLARAIIRQNKILVLDEATANVDPQTDALIQKTLKEKFSNCTVLTIAHRLDTVMGSDKIMVINNGMLVEFDSPKSLLEKKDSAFYNMVVQSGLSFPDEGV